MKTYIIFLLAAISVVTGKFEFTEEWELWKTVMISSMGDSDVQCSCQLAACTLCLVLNTIYAGVHRNMRRCIHQMRKRTNDM